MGNTEVIDTMINDGLSDAFYDYHMGVTAENIAEKFDISRKNKMSSLYKVNSTRTSH